MIHKLGRRFAVMFSGEILQSSFNFGLNVTLASTLTARDYGFFAIVMVIGGFGLLYMRAMVGVPACIVIPQSRRESAARAHAVTFGSFAIVLSVLATAIVSAILAFWQPAAAFFGGAFVGAWSFRSYVRMLLFAQFRATLATVSDLVFTFSAALFCLAPVLGHGRDMVLPDILVGLTAANWLAAGSALLMLRQPIRISFRWSVRRRFLSLLPTMRGSILSVTVANVQAQGPALALAAIAGSAAYAPIAATIAFFAPLRLAASALGNMLQPDFATVLAGADQGAVRKLMPAPAMIIACICALYGLMMIVVFPNLSRHLFGQRFPGTRLDLIALEIWCIATMAVIYSVPKTLLETAREFRRIIIISAIGALVGMSLTVAIIVASGSPSLSLVGLLTSELIVFVGLWVAAKGLVRRRVQPAPANARRPPHRVAPAAEKIVGRPARPDAGATSNPGCKQSVFALRRSQLYRADGTIDRSVLRDRRRRMR